MMTGGENSLVVFTGLEAHLTAMLRDPSSNHGWLLKAAEEEGVANAKA
jgi:hypothetical protein